MRRAGARWMAMALVAAVSVAPTPAASAASDSFVGDYRTADFSQWPLVHNSRFYGDGADYEPSYPATIVSDETYGHAARFEVRAGDVLPKDKGGGERSEVMASDASGGTEGSVMWYQFATKFDSTFPMNHAELGFGITNQFWAARGASPPIAWSAGERDGYWSLVIEPQASPAAYLGKLSILDVPLDVGQWHQVTMQVRWSAQDDQGWIKVWLNGQRQIFANGEYTFRVRTLIPGAKSVRYKEGYYRHRAPGTPTGIVYHAAFRCGTGDPPGGS